MFVLLEHYCDPSLDIQDTPLKSQFLVGVYGPCNIKAREIEIPVFMKRPLFRGMWNITDGKVPDQGDATVIIVQELASIKSHDEAAKMIANSLMLWLSKPLAFH
ncbi:hypothetical protein BGW36DRAFT_359213 [Talaromyces proteolyticus]|uniref:Uncharacterized protein n=1 Tax=Talaromyces proteolyticus TaxID=1131652 RepID=A0AAD4KR34_9EURO|nr:uncharacterized protein BGW36DRAFT_359213 [Talaromyces proteolyticus]KAH8697421.1 hypothetical protein BGW36DRAFT_359213 [Talaromyces proteolyticus]